MKLPLKLSRSRSKSSSINESPLPSPLAPSSLTVLNCASPPSPNSPKPASKSLFSDKGKTLQLRLPSLPRNRNRGSKCEIVAAEPSPKPLSPLGPSNTHVLQQASDSAPSRKGISQEPLVQEMKRVFEKFDSNGDGKISAEELQCVLRALKDNVTREEAELMVAEADTDNDGFIDLQEFMNLNMRGNGLNDSGLSTESVVTEELAAAFNMFDLDKNGCITPDELHCVLGNLGNKTSTLEDCKRMISNVDRKGCGYVDFDDFKVMMATSNTTIIA